jgi:prepilin-type N-terminal cleavage/methylation domain-containing protein
LIIILSLIKKAKGGSLQKTGARERGMTLIELLVVMVLIGLSISVVIPNIGRSFDKIKFKGQTKKCYELVQKAKFHAFYYQKPVTLSAQDRRLVIQGVTLAENEIPDVPVEIKSEISFSANGVSSGGEIILFFKDEPKAVIRIETFSGRVTRGTL